VRPGAKIHTRVKLYLGLVAASALVAVVVGFWPETDQGAELPEVSSQESSPPPALRSPQISGQRGAATEFEPLPSHENTDVDGGVMVDADGKVVPERGLRRLFDYFLTGIGRDDIAGLRQRLAAFLAQRDLPEDVQEQVLARFDTYIEYQHQLGDVEPPSDAVADMLRAFQERRDLRVSVLGRETADGFFGREEAEDRYVLAMKALSEADHLSAEERQARQEILEQRLPADIRAARERSAVAVTLQEKTQRLRDSGATEAELWRMREEVVGPEAAARLASLDQGREQWQERVSVYRKERDRLLTLEGLAPEDRQAAVHRLIEQHFEAHEVRRVRALDRMEAGTAP